MTVKNCRTCAHRETDRKGREKCLRLGLSLDTARLFGFGLGCDERFSGWEAIPAPVERPSASKSVARAFWRGFVDGFTWGCVRRAVARWTTRR